METVYVYRKYLFVSGIEYEELTGNSVLFSNLNEALKYAKFEASKKDYSINGDLDDYYDGLIKQLEEEDGCD